MRRRRGGYWVAWSVVTGSCLGLGTVVTLLVDPPAALVLMAIMATGAACLLTTVVKQAEHGAGRFVLRAALLLMLVLTGVNGLAAALGGVTVELVLLLAITGAPLAWQALHRKESEPERVAAPAPAPPRAEPVATAPAFEPALLVDTTTTFSGVPPTTAALCWTWRASFTALRRADGLDERLRIVELRQRCLDELARREPTGFHNWLAAGARAAGDPSKYVCVRHQPPAREERHHDGLDDRYHG